ncbi:MAG: hypothetical protein RR140_03620 [Clostridia bacterium]
MKIKDNKINEKQDEKKLIEEIKNDFLKRQNEKKGFDAQWQLNMNFVMGNQNCSVGRNGEIEEFEKEFFWQEREVFNHILPVMEMRASKLQKVRPTMTVVPASGDDKDIKTAQLSKKIVNSVYSKEDMNKTIISATNWSEICGTSFYKIVWNSNGGTTVANYNGKNVKNGEVEISVCSPFEIFPESTNSQDLESCKSLIHAKAYHIDEIKRIWGAEVEGENVNVFSLDSAKGAIGGLGYEGNATKVIGSTRSNYAVVIERYESPTIEFPDGRLIIVAGDKILYNDILPYVNDVDGQRGYPFIMQKSVPTIGCFWGTSVIERMIPVQRAYNAVKNRKHEYLNRITMGVLMVEDGSVDVENLEDEGLSPGKILVYRQGSSQPRYMPSNNVPIDFSAEEERLLNEFLLISGASDLMRNFSSFRNMSGNALEVLVEQDNSRLSVTIESIREAIKSVGQKVLRLYKQFADMPRLSKIVGENGEIEIFFFSASDISSDDIVFDTDNEFTQSLAQKRNMVYELLNAGLLQDENGKLSNRMRVKALEALGFGTWENAHDVSELHIKRASNENLKMLSGKEIDPLEIDDHETHITQHISFMLGGEFEKKNNSKLNEIYLQHIRKHKQLKSLQNQIEGVENGK